MVATKNVTMSAKVHGGSCKAYKMKLSPLEQKILMNIQLGVKFILLQGLTYISSDDSEEMNPPCLKTK